MAKAQLRGYMITRTASYLRQAAAARGIADPTEKLRSSTRSALSDIQPVGWYPVAYAAELNQLIVSALGGDDETRARAELEKCGRFMAEEATNTFMRLLMRVLTPTLFANKLPSLWRRDADFGKLDLDVDDRKLTLKLSEMDGHDHVAPLMIGFVGFALEKMGKEIVETNLKGWSLANPNGNGVSLEFVWKS